LIVEGARKNRQAPVIIEGEAVVLIDATRAG
jgi:hypothetical protein